MISAAFILGLPMVTAVDPVDLISGDGIPLTFDVWVDGSHTTRTTLGGVPTHAEIDGVYIDLLPIPLGADLRVLIQIVPTIAGSHRVGIGFDGQNGGAVIEGPLGQALDIQLDLQGAMCRFLGNCFCDKTIAISMSGVVRSPSQIVDVKSLIYTKGTSFGPNDSIFVESASIDGDFYGTNGLVRTGECPGFFSQVFLPAEAGPTIIFFGESDTRFHVNVADAPTEVFVTENTNAAWDGGWQVWVSAPISGTGDGIVKKQGLSIPVHLDFLGLRSATIKWDNEHPWLFIGAGPQSPGDHLFATSAGNFGIRATRDWDGIHRRSVTRFLVADPELLVA